jgi:hypothetical protein
MFRNVNRVPRKAITAQRVERRDEKSIDANALGGLRNRRRSTISRMSPSRRQYDAAGVACVTSHRRQLRNRPFDLRFG